MSHEDTKTPNGSSREGGEVSEGREGGNQANPELTAAIKAAWRLRYYGYHDWALAGGLNECTHGIAEGIPCERCDELLLRKTYDQLTSPPSLTSPP